jgi:hypothetical protein
MFDGGKQQKIDGDDRQGDYQDNRVADQAGNRPTPMAITA